MKVRVGRSERSEEAKFLVPDLGDKVDSGIGLRSTLS
jgi:hypothetical protein